VIIGHGERNLPSEFSIIFAVWPSITATAEFVVPNNNCGQHTEKIANIAIRGAFNIPKSIPITGPLTFLSASSEFHRLAKDDPNGVRMDAGRVIEVALGSCFAKNMLAL
jgi:hypothetical protein